MSDRYRPEQVFPIAVPQWSRSADGRWAREWEVRLAEELRDEARPALANLSEAGIDVSAEVRGDRRTIVLRTLTDLNPLSDDVFYGAAYRMLRRIDETVGRIETIQGQPRDRWQPFRHASGGV